LALTVVKATFSYGAAGSPAPCPLFSDFGAEFPRGAVTAVTGPNGSGKTTLARLLVGILRPQSGDVYIDGDPVRSMTLTEVGRMVGYVMQDPSRQIFKTTILDEMMFGLRNMGMGVDEATERACEYLGLFGLAGRETVFPFDLSVGERQRLVLAAVLAMKPSYLVLDEPTASLDPGRKRALGGYLSDAVAKDGIGVVLISHDMKFVKSYADAGVALAPVPVRGTGAGAIGDGSCVAASRSNADALAEPVARMASPCEERDR
jgi:energy-coupling factor transport system ATP-binding protein